MSNPDPNDPGPAILADLGIAREVDEGKQLGAAQTTAVKGTGPYIDPIYSAIGRFGPWSDIYSFGIVLVQVLTGASPEDVVDKGSQVSSMPQPQPLRSITLDQRP